ncbi:MAG TPA: class F sortase [Micromonosporaceae bacterium]|nr:class F sortase [Micromonosporaceae bacterium]
MAEFPRDQSRRWWVVAVALLMLAAASFATGLRDRGDALAGGSTTWAGPQRSSPDAAVAGVAATAGALQTRSAPIELRIPAIDVTVALSTLGLADDGTVEVPSNFAEAGWFQLGPSPGQTGSAVILGHVDSHRGPAVFFRLRSLRAGDRIEVTREDGVVAHFAVRTVATYPKQQFPARQVYGPHGNSALQLVTCGGTFDRATRSYRSNVVVYTDLVATSTA